MCSGEVIHLARKLHGTMPELPSALCRSEEDKFFLSHYVAQAIDLMLNTDTYAKSRKKKPALNKRIPDKLFRKLHKTSGVAQADHTP